MSQQNKVRLAGIALITLMLLCWMYPSYGVFRDYLALLNKEPVVRVSVLTLWVPMGCLGAVFCLLWMSPKALYYGKGIGKVYSSNAIKLANKICISFALIGVAFAAGWTYHTLDLLEQYGYVYSRDLTKITPTGIHLMYILSN
ncbi:hypothetical protein RUK98_003238 [Vibrio cholerae]|uniref:Uncharacterized protein n=1 Tax=Vibrio paracholerae TaxID=650003 RepID=A0ABD7FVE7_9VIBR|nr:MULTISPECIES: hypothetical protein [Vibrio]EGR0264426.1 hypothetical protein [Vibrio cholerae]EGR1094448.1 hypothetical protein [Vibrio cholerae]ELJ8717557.1 hypothetical protein [Vibrio cholerae]PAR30722.1 hypothetical protein CGT99_14970 [Vibrio metoecus]RBM67107.1 hypothetical protein DLR72_10240 [Vibrio paracholerae]